MAALIVRGLPRSARAAAVVILLPLLVPPAAAQAPTDDEVKAAYVYHFGRFVTWPPAATAGPFAICMMGRDPLGAVIESTIRGERLDGRPVAMRYVGSPDDLAGCHVLVVSRSEERQLATRLAQVRGRPILTVSDIPDFVARGGMIELVHEGNRVRFLVDPARADAAGLSLSSDLLRVARIFKGAAATGDR